MVDYRRWHLVAATGTVLLALAVALSMGGAAARAASAGSSITGEWSILNNTGGTDDLLVTRTGPHTYTFANDEGFSVTDIDVPLTSSGGSVKTCWIAVGLPNSPCPIAGRGWDDETFKFNLTKCPGTLTGSYQDHYADGTEFASGTYTGGRLSGGPSCRRKTNVVLSGSVYYNACYGPSGYAVTVAPCKIEDRPWEGNRVTLSGPGRTQSTLIGRDGSYSFRVRRGKRYTITVPTVRTSDPAERVVDARADVSGLDFLVCRPLPGSKTCKLSEIDGKAVDIDGDPFKGVTVTGVGASTTTDATGQFVLFVDRGPQTLTAVGPSYGPGSKADRAIPKGKVDVDATHSVSKVRLTVNPAIRIPDVTITSTVAGATMTVYAAGLPPNGKFFIDGKSTGTGSCGSAINGQEFEDGSLRTAEHSFDVGGATRTICPAYYEMRLSPSSPDGNWHVTTTTDVRCTTLAADLHGEC